MKTKLFLFIYLLSCLAWSQVYNSRLACTAAFKTANPNLANSTEANEKFCFGKYTLTADEAKWVNCVEEKMRKSYGASYNVNDSVGQIARSNFKSECLRAASNQQAAASQTQAAQTAAQTAAQNQANANNPMAQAGGLGTVMQMAPVAISAYQMMGKGNDKKPGASASSGGSNSTNPTSTTNQAANSAATQGNNTAGSSSSDVPKDEDALQRIVDRNTEQSSTDSSVNSQPTTGGTSDTPAPVAQQVTPESGDAVRAISPDLEKPVSSVEGAPTDPAKVSPPQTEMTKVDGQVSESFTNEVRSAASPLPASTEVNYATTSQLIDVIRQEAESYKNVPKDECTKSAERAKLLCVENTSPGAKAVKMLLDFGGPVLGAISSAQKACSSTQKVMNYAAMGLAAAKGVCVGAKFMCDQSCNKATKYLNSTAAKIQKARAYAEKEHAHFTAVCAYPRTCQPINESIHKMALQRIQALEAAYKKEAAPTEGTAQSRVVLCQGLAKDVMLLAANIGSTLMAANSAKKCSDQLSSNPSGGGITTAQYCEQPANAGLQVCVCQRNNMAPGCPGALATTNANSPSAVKPVATFSKNPTPGITNGSSNAGDIGKINDGFDPSYSGGNGALAGGFNTAGSGGLGSAASDAAGGVSSETGEAAGDNKKKWNLGGLSDYVGGLFGKNGSGGDSNSKFGVGGKDADALKRQIASEKIRAEVSSASGKSNWEKIRQMYIIKNSSFVLGR